MCSFRNCFFILYLLIKIQEVITFDDEEYVYPDNEEYVYDDTNVSSEDESTTESTMTTKSESYENGDLITVLASTQATTKVPDNYQSNSKSDSLDKDPQADTEPSVTVTIDTIRKDKPVTEIQYKLSDPKTNMETFCSKLDRNIKETHSHINEKMKVLTIENNLKNYFNQSEPMSSFNKIIFCNQNQITVNFYDVHSSAAENLGCRDNNENFDESLSESTKSNAVTFKVGQAASISGDLRKNENPAFYNLKFGEDLYLNEKGLISNDVQLLNVRQNSHHAENIFYTFEELCKSSFVVGRKEGYINSRYSTGASSTGSLARYQSRSFHESIFPTLFDYNYYDINPYNKQRLSIFKDAKCCGAMDDIFPKVLKDYTSFRFLDENNIKFAYFCPLVDNAITKDYDLMTAFVNSCQMISPSLYDQQSFDKVLSTILRQEITANFTISSSYLSADFWNYFKNYKFKNLFSKSFFDVYIVSEVRRSSAVKGRKLYKMTRILRYANVSARGFYNFCHFYYTM